MSFRFSKFTKLLIFAAFLCALNLTATAQEKSAPEVLNEKDAAVIVPSSFYFAGQSAPTQMRNSAVARLGKDRRVIAGLVDTSGYSTEISGKYEGFLITDSPILIGDKTLETGAYGFGFSADGKLRIFDLSSREIFSIDTMNDKEMKRPRPLMMTSDANGVRLYKGKNYATITPKSILK